MIQHIPNRIEINPKVMVGKPVIKGTRITVEQILRHLAQGMAVDEIIENYPHLKPEDIRAALDYASERVADEETYSLKYEGPKTFA